MVRSGDPGMVDPLMRAARIARGAEDGERLARAMTVLCEVGPVSEAGAPRAELVALLDLALAGADEPDTVARISASASYHYSLTGDWERCRSLYERAISAGGGSRAMAEVLPFAAVVLGGPDDLGRRSDAADRLDLIAEDDRDLLARAEARYVRIGVQVQLGDPRFRETLDEMIELEHVVSGPGIRWSIACMTAALQHIEGDLAAAEVTAATGCRGVADSRRRAGFGAQLVALRAEEDRLPELLPMLEELVAEQPEVGGWRAVLVGALAAAGHADAARREFDRLAPENFAALPHDFTWTAAMTTLTCGIARTGDAVRARLAYDALGPYAGRMSWTGNCTVGPIDAALGEAALTLGDEARAGAHFRRALEVAERLGAPRMALRARSRLPGRG